MTTISGNFSHWPLYMLRKLGLCGLQLLDLFLLKVINIFYCNPLKCDSYFFLSSIDSFFSIPYILDRYSNLMWFVKMVYSIGLVVTYLILIRIKSGSSTSTIFSSVTFGVVREKFCLEDISPVPR